MYRVDGKCASGRNKKKRQAGEMSEEAMIFDQYSRYFGTSSILEKSSIEFSSVLDIGSGPYCLLGNFLRGKDITYLDPLLKEVSLPDKRVITDSIFDLDVNAVENKKDVVVSIDTYEHIPLEKRNEFVERCVHLSRGVLLFAFPCGDTSHARELDQIIHSQYQSVYGEKYSWLKEHDEYGLPSSAELQEFLKKKGWHVKSFKHGKIEWLKDLLPKIILLHGFPEMYSFIIRISDYFNRHFAENDWVENDGAGDGYRRIVLASKDPFSMEDGAGKSVRQVERREWEEFMTRFFIELTKEIRVLPGTSSSGDILERDKEISRLSKIVSETSETIKNMYNDILTRDDEIRRLASVLESSSEEIRRLRAELAPGYEKIQQLKK